MNILFTGLTGLVGSHLANLIHRDLVKDGIFREINFFTIHRSEKNNNISLSPNSICNCNFTCDCRDIEKLTAILKKTNPKLIIHIVQVKYTKFILKAIELSKIRKPKLIIIGSLGLFSNYQSEKKEYIEAEKLMSSYHNEIILLRSGMIYGSKYDKNMHKLINFISKNNIVPLPFAGTSLFQPVFYQDISLAIFSIMYKYISEGSFHGGKLNLSGPDTLSLKEICLVISKYFSKELSFINLPTENIYNILSFIESKGIKSFPIKSEQIMRLKEDKIFSSDWENENFNILPTHFKDGIQSQINSLFDPTTFLKGPIFREF